VLNTDLRKSSITDHKSDINKTESDSNIKSRTQKVQSIHEQISSDVNAARYILNNLETLDDKTKARYNKLFGNIMMQAKTNLANAKKDIFSPFMNQDQKSTNPSVSLEKLASLSNELLGVLRVKDITAIQNCLRPQEEEAQSRLKLPIDSNSGITALDIACQNLVKAPPHEIQPIKFQRDEAAKSLAQIIDSKGQGVLVADIDYTLINTSDPDRRSVMPKEFIENARELMQHGVTVALISGRETGAILPSLKNGGADQAFIDKLEIYSEYGAMHIGPSTEGKEIVTNKQAEKYLDAVKEYCDTLTECIKNDKQLNDDPQLKDLTQQQDLLIRKNLGCVILGVPQREALEKNLREQDLSEEVVQEKVMFVYGRLHEIALEIRNEKPEYKAFLLKDTKITGIDLRLNPDITGLKLDKGTALASLIEKQNLKGVVIFGDDIADLEMTKVAQDLQASYASVRDDGSKSEIKMETLENAVLEAKEKFDSNLTNADIQKAVQARNKLNKEFASLLRNRLESKGIALESQAFVGVERPNSMTEDIVRKTAALMAKNTDSAVEIIREITKEIAIIKNKYKKKYKMTIESRVSNRCAICLGSVSLTPTIRSETSG
jgi:hydroxymethylpyrimidine pyrophosphatase-like HAD family hydrolase